MFECDVLSTFESVTRVDERIFRVFYNCLYLSCIYFVLYCCIYCMLVGVPLGPSLIRAPT